MIRLLLIVTLVVSAEFTYAADDDITKCITYTMRFLNTHPDALGAVELVSKKTGYSVAQIVELGCIELRSQHPEEFRKKFGSPQAVLESVKSDVQNCIESLREYLLSQGVDTKLLSSVEGNSVMEEECQKYKKLHLEEFEERFGHPRT